MSGSAKRGRPELRPLRKVIRAGFIGATSALQIELECGHQVNREGWRSSSSNHTHAPAQCRCDECPRRDPTMTAENSPPQAADEPQTPPVLLPHVWVQRTLGDPMLAGQVMTSDGRQAGYQRGPGVGWLPLPIRFAPRTQEGLDQLFDQLLADANRALKGAA